MQPHVAEGRIHYQDTLISLWYTVYAGIVCVKKNVKAELLVIEVTVACMTMSWQQC